MKQINRLLIETQLTSCHTASSLTSTISRSLSSDARHGFGGKAVVVAGGENQQVLVVLRPGVDEENAGST